MKCVMRIVTVAQADVAAVAPMLVGKLTEILSELCQGFAHGIAPKNPAFHHFIFESLAAVIRHVCASGDAGAVKSMEDVMLPPFQVGGIPNHTSYLTSHTPSVTHTRSLARTNANFLYAFLLYFNLISFRCSPLSLPPSYPLIPPCLWPHPLLTCRPLPPRRWC